MNDPDPSTEGTLSISPSEVSNLAVRSTQTIRTYIDGRRERDPASAGITFESADPRIASVSADGVITGELEGNTTVTIHYGDQDIIVNVEVQVGL